VYEFSRISYARGLGYYELEAMKESVAACQRLFNQGNPLANSMWDTMYMLQVISYGELQRHYKKTGESPSV
jgi:hypothetical protein